MSRRFSLTRAERLQIAERFYKKVKQKYQKDVDFCKAYDIAQGTLGNWKNRGNINLALIIQFCTDEDVNLNYIFRNLTPEDIPKKVKPS